MKIRRIVGVVVLNSEGKFVILKRSSDKKVHANLWNVPSGGVEKGESLPEAAKREVFEETGLNFTDLKKGPTSSIVVSSELIFEIHYFVAKTRDSKVMLNNENTEYKWVRPEEALNFEYASSKDEVLRILNSFGLL